VLAQANSPQIAGRSTDKNGADQLPALIDAGR